MLLPDLLAIATKMDIETANGNVEENIMENDPIEVTARKAQEGEVSHFFLSKIIFVKNGI